MLHCFTEETSKTLLFDLVDFACKMLSGVSHETCLFYFLFILVIIFTFKFEFSCYFAFIKVPVIVLM